MIPLWTWKLAPWLYHFWYFNNSFTSQTYQIINLCGYANFFIGILNSLLILLQGKVGRVHCTYMNYSISVKCTVELSLVKLKLQFATPPPPTSPTFPLEVVRRIYSSMVFINCWQLAKNTGYFEVSVIYSKEKRVKWRSKSLKLPIASMQAKQCLIARG